MRSPTPRSGPVVLPLLAAAFLTVGCDVGTAQFRSPAQPDLPADPLVASIGGQVLDADTGLPLVGAAVSADGKTVASAADGSYQILDVRNHVVRLTATHDGYAPRDVQGLPLSAGHNVYVVRMTPTTASAQSPGR